MKRIAIFIITLLLSPTSTQILNPDEKSTRPNSKQAETSFSGTEIDENLKRRQFDPKIAFNQQIVTPDNLGQLYPIASLISGISFFGDETDDVNPIFSKRDFSCINDQECESNSCFENVCQEFIANNVPTVNIGGRCSPSLKCIASTCIWGVCISNLWVKTDFSDWTNNSLVPLDWKSLTTYGANNRFIVQDPITNSGKVLEVLYPAGSSNPGGNLIGGTGFYANPIDLSTSKVIALEYQVLFPTGFNFVMGGKLPGLYGGHKSCSGGNAAVDCFSTRLMFRSRGSGEAYLYLDKKAQSPLLCGVNCNAHTTYGYSIGRGQFTFATGRWNKIRQVVKLNTFTDSVYNQDGVFQLYLNEVLVIESRVVAYRTAIDVVALGIDFETFFGGHGDLYSTPLTQCSYFKGFKLGAF